ncbi:Putative monooxygenase [Mycobacteroides abscessus subsp. abscessus]|nr:Putative monooxygenase [Mycobacteroides abscessus subsp. abscessus]
MYFHNKYFRLDNYRYGTERIAPAVKTAPKRKRNKEVVR